jgi:DNA invertase Pin-like site-specific DNA recombinase
VLAILAVIAKQERIRLSECTLAGLSRARAAGRVGGRPKVVVSRDRVHELSAGGRSCREIATELGVSHSSVSRILSAWVPASGVTA